MPPPLRCVTDETSVRESHARKGEGFIYACTVRGESHKTKNSSCQDAHLVWVGEENGLDFHILAVADGHGAARHDLSEYGSELAVRAAVARLREMCHNFGSSNHNLWNNFSLHFPRLLQNSWQRDVIHHAANYSSCQDKEPPNDELTGLPCEVDQSPVETVQEHIESDVQAQHELFVRYGTTLSVAICTPTHLLMGRLGDGDTVLFHQDNLPLYPFPPNDQIRGVFSLCHSEAPLLWEVSCHERSQHDLLLLTTDGLANSFDDTGGSDAFERFVRSFQARIRQEEVERVMSDIAPWLNQCSQQGSQDDITLAFVLLGRLQPLLNLDGLDSNTGKEAAIEPDGDVDRNLESQLKPSVIAESEISVSAQAMQLRSTA